MKNKYYKFNKFKESNKDCMIIKLTCNLSIYLKFNYNN